MKTYLRIMNYARPWKKILPGYLIFSVLTVGFGLVNMTLLKPLFNVIFNQVETEELISQFQKPEFSFSIEYLESLFNYYMTETVVNHGKFGALIYVCIVIIVALMLSNLFRYLSSLIMAIARARIIREMRIDVFRNVSNLHVGYFTEQRKGDIMSRIATDIQQIESSITHNLRVMFREPFTIIVYFVLLVYTSPKLTLFVVVLLPVSGIFISLIAKKLKKRALKSQESLGRILNILDETLGGMRVIKAFNAINYINRTFSNEAKNYSNIDVSWSKRYELASPISELLGAISIGGILAYGGDLVLNKETLDASSFMVFIVVFTQILQPAKALTSAVTHFQRGIASGERVFEIIDTESKIKNIEFRNVSFSYGEKQVLQNISFTIEKGKTIALVGPSGGGKSTLANLIPRFYDPVEGDVLIDGVSLKDYDIGSLRDQMGIVTQESILFNDTIFNNIAFGLDDIKEAEVTNAAKVANAHDFIIQSEKGYQRNVGDRGSKLSGGQKQRITIARALLKNPAILILDEATSALDSESEKLVQEAINNLMKARTSLVIAHRLSTIQNADEILVIDEGKIVERGTHNELLKLNGIYQKLQAMQSV